MQMFFPPSLVLGGKGGGRVLSCLMDFMQWRTEISLGWAHEFYIQLLGLQETLIHKNRNPNRWPPLKFVNFAELATI